MRKAESNCVLFCVWKWKNAGISGEHIRVTLIAMANSKPKKIFKTHSCFCKKKMFTAKQGEK